jgi:hypothetical protein
VPATRKTVRELKITAALYASRPGVLEHVRTTGRLPDETPMGGGHIGMRLLIEKRGTDITMTPDEQLMVDALIKENRLPGGIVILVDEAKKGSGQRMRSIASKVTSRGRRAKS